ncbi:MAG TPA: serine hydrolase domain-containing protein [Puia sp.]|nr:serine hydrolase domain-containing protein [Puia sp.]
MILPKLIAMNRMVALFTLVMLFVIYARAQRHSPDVGNRIKRVERNLCSEIQVEGEPNWTLEERMKFYHVNGVSIAVIRNYKIDWTRGFGWADREEHRRVTTATLFQAGSMSKSLNAVGVLRLVQDGRLNLYEDINSSLRTWKFPYDSLSGGKKITLANLLSHTAGLNVHGFPGYERGDQIPTLEQIADGVSPANTPAIRSAFEPSLKGQYSGGGIFLSQMIVQDAATRAYDSFMKDSVLKPLNMTNSFFTQPPPAGKEGQLATGYLSDGKGVKGKYHIYPEEAAAGLWTTPTDLAKYIIETQLSVKGKSNKVLSQAMTRLMLTPYENRVFGLGVFIDTIGGQIYFSHGGQDRGFIGRYFGTMDGGNGVVVMTNTDDIPIVNEIINSVAIVYKWKGFYQPFMVLKKKALDEAVLNSYTGRYIDTATSEGQFDLRRGSVFTIAKAGHHLKARTGTGQEIDIYPQSDSVFFPKTSDTDITFIKNEKGVVTKLTVHQNGKYFGCRKIKG